jgi:serine/threonine protein kinase/tetratricopeptide (TPR) repeat protein
MNEKDSVFGVEPERLRQLIRSGMDVDDVDAEDPPAPSGSAGGVMERPGTQIGCYKLLHVLGEGGMGVVYLAEQEFLIRRRVALKIIKPGMDSRRVLARFDAERQALALLDHPNIARVYDAGMTGVGRPYFVMEYVKGSPITEYCDHHKLSIEDRLALFAQVCDAVQHAHQKGIIHRDIKPSNILVSTENDRAIPKIIDFGVAKAVGRPLTDRTLFTEDSQLLGTPEYMSPEQADMATEDIDTRSDVYSLGVLLYVLLTGVLPFDPQTLRDSGIENIRRTIRETDPKTPSTRLTGLGEEAAKIAEMRQMEVNTLTKHLKKELEWIPLKAMRKERSERYRSASELAGDIEDYLKGIPLIAGPIGTGYKVKKFVCRNRVLVSGIAAVLVVLVAGVTVSTILAVGQARALVENRLVVDFLKNDVLGSASQANVGEATVSYLLDAGSKTLGDKFKDKPLLEAEICQTLGWTYRQIGELNQAEQHLLKAIRIYQEHYGKAHPATLGARSQLGWVYRDQGRYDEMEQLWTENLQIGQRVWPVIDQVHAMNHLGVAHMIRGKYKEAESLFDKMLYLDQHELHGEYAERSPWFLGNLAVAYLNQGRYDEAERLLKETIRTVEGREDLAGDHRKLGLMQSLAVTHVRQGQYDEAERLFVETLKAFRLLQGDTHRNTLHCMRYFADLRIEQEHYAEAEDLLQEALETAREQLGKDHPFLLSLEHDLARLKTKQGKYDEAETLFDRVLEGTRREKGDDDLDTLRILNDFGILRREQGQYDQAESLLHQALEGRQRNLGPDHLACFGTMHELGVLYKVQARYEEAEKYLLKAVEGRRLKLGDKHPHTLESWHNLIDLYEAWGKSEQAARWRAELPS